jgi:hypothetical protein
MSKMTHRLATHTSHRARVRPRAVAGARCPAGWTVCCLLLTLTVALAFAPAAHASKDAVDFFGGNGTLGGQFGDARSVTVNETGAGPANPGDVYVFDANNKRIERFGRDDNGTPGNTPGATADDTYFFISAWGADVDSTPSGGFDYEICTVAAECQAGVASGGNGTAAGNGVLGNPDKGGSLALDQDTGNLYVADAGNFRINVYDGTGTFLRSFGYDVVESGPEDAGSGYEVCLAANDDVCKKGAFGAATGQIGLEVSFGVEHPGAHGIAISAPDGNPATGTVFLADSGNRRIDTYALDGSGPTSFGSGNFPEVFLHNNNIPEPTEVAVDSRGIVYIGTGAGGDPRIERYDSQNANGGGVGFLAPILSPRNEEQWLSEEATAGQFRLTFDPDGAGPQPAETTPAPGLPFNADRDQVRAALEALSSIGPGNVSTLQGFTGVQNIGVTFTGTLADTDVAQLTVTNGATPLTGSIPVHTSFDGHPGLAPRAGVRSLAVDPDTDGPGPDTDVLYAERGQLIQQFGPLNPPGLTAPPSAVDEVHGTFSGAFSGATGLAVEPATGRLYAAAGGTAGPGVYVLDVTGPPPTASMDSVDGVTSNSADLHATIDPNGPPATRYHFDYIDDATYQATGFAKAFSTTEQFLGVQEDPQPVGEHLEPLPVGLEPNTEYHMRLVAGRKFAPPIITNELTFTTDPAPPLAETVGAPIRTTATAQLNGRVTPLGTLTTYHFEYGAAGPCNTNPCDSTPSVPAGSGQLTMLASAEVTGLDPDTTYHYRIVADNGVGAPAGGEDMTVHTRASDELPGQSDEFPGPPGSDRAWELVSIPDSSGNPIAAFFFPAFSDAGDRAVYGLAGGSPVSPTGSLQNLHYSERTASGWRALAITPTRDQLVGGLWRALYASADLSTIVTQNSGYDGGATDTQLWRLQPGSSPTLLAHPYAREEYGLSLDGSRTIGFSDDGAALDPIHPSATEPNFYDLDSSPPDLVSLLPGDLVSPCGVVAASTGVGRRGSHWVSDDGDLVLFESQPDPPCATSPAQLYLRDLSAGETKLVSGPVISGLDCDGRLVNATSEAVFFTSQSRLDPADADPASCNGSSQGNDVYRYDLADGSLKCLTCLFPGFSVDVIGRDADNIGVSDDGSRVYFQSEKRLVSGAPPDGQRGTYRITLPGGKLDYLGPTRVGGLFGESSMSADGSILAFSSSSASLNPLGGTADNDGTVQYYRYDDADRSLVCVSCPRDGSPPLAGLLPILRNAEQAGLNNQGSLSDDGKVFAFASPTPYVGADQNTSGPGVDPARGTDVYEWRDGRLALVTDGQTDWEIAAIAPFVEGVTPNGSDVFFAAAAAYTPDAPDALLRLYDARIGGGFHFPPPGLPPCDLGSGACEGAGSSAPDQPGAGSAVFSGPGNQPTAQPKGCPKGKRKVRRKGRTVCVAKKHRRRHHKRAQRSNRKAQR